MTSQPSNLEPKATRTTEPRSGPPTICKCGLAKSYHYGPHNLNPGHTYEPRYEPMAWRDGYERGRAEAAASAGLDALREALRLFDGRLWGDRPTGDYAQAVDHLIAAARLIQDNSQPEETT